MTNLTDHDPGSLRGTIAQAASGDTILFDASLHGTIVLTGGELALTRDVTIASPAASQITISGNQAGRVLTVFGGVTAVLAGLTITNGMINGHGGGIVNSGTLTLAGCIITGNTSTNGDGGGIYNDGTLALGGSTVSHNMAGQTTPNNTPGDGGGVYNAGTLVVASSVLSYNSSNNKDGGGAIYNAGILQISGSMLDSNTAPTSSAAVLYNAPQGMATVTGCTIDSNSSYNVGGVFLNRGTLTVNNTDMAYNNTVGSGGVLYQSSGGTATLNASTLTRNQAGGFGGVLENNGRVTFTPDDDGGQYAFSGVMLATLGLQTITATDDGGLTKSYDVLVTPPQATRFEVSARAEVKPGKAFTITVTVLDAFGRLFPDYTGTVHFSTTDLDPRVVLPADYTFTAADAGVHTFSDTGLGETTLWTHGFETITIADTADGSLMAIFTVKVQHGRHHAGSPDVGVDPTLAVADQAFTALMSGDGAGLLIASNHRQVGIRGGW